MAEIMEMPKLSDTMVEGVIAAWHKKVGESIKSGELLTEVETDKATMEVESFYDGVLLYKGVEEGGTIDIGGLLAIVGEKGEDISAILAKYKTKTAAKSSGSEEKVVLEAPVLAESAEKNSVMNHSTSTNGHNNGASDGRLKASPLAKALARETGIELSQIPGTGEGGRIVKKDIEFFLKSGGPKSKTKSSESNSPGTFIQSVVTGTEKFSEVPVSQMRKTIARRLADSKFTAPHFYLTMEIDMENAVTARNDLNLVSPVKISFNDMIIKAAAAALRQHPAVNSSWLGDNIRYNEHIHVGMAVAVEEGLLVPVIRFADSKSLSQIAGETNVLAEKARDKKLQPADWEGNTFTISNLGMFGIEEFTAIINPPDACIMAVGGIIDKPVVKDGQIVAGKTMKVTLSCDHRVVDGVLGSKFLQTFKSYLESPVRILI